MRFTTMTHFVVGPSHHPPHYRMNELTHNWYQQLFTGSPKTHRGKHWASKMLLSLKAKPVFVNHSENWRLLFPRLKMAT